MLLVDRLMADGANEAAAGIVSEILARWPGFGIRHALERWPLWPSDLKTRLPGRLAIATISGNTGDNGGGISADSEALAAGDPTVTITNSTISGNTASINGGGVNVADDKDSGGSPALTLNNVTVYNNIGGNLYRENDPNASLSVVSSIIGSPATGSNCAGGAVTNISIATSESWKDKNTGQQQERTEWHRGLFQPACRNRG